MNWLHEGLADPDSVSSVFEEVMKGLRLQHADLLLNSGAVCPDCDKDDRKRHEWDDIIQTNIKVHSVIMLVLYHMLARPPAHERVVNPS